MEEIIRAASIIICAERARELMSAESFLDMFGLTGSVRQEVKGVLADYDIAYTETVQRPMWDDEWSLDNQTKKEFVWNRK